MSEGDWLVIPDAVSQATIDRGVTSGFTPPNGGGSFVYGFNSLAPTPGSSGLLVNLANFIPMAKGGLISAAMKRALSGGPTNFAPMIALCLASESVNANGYLLGLSDADPHHIVLRKGTINTSIPDNSVGLGGCLRQSTATFANDTWLHLRLDAIVNLNGDVILKCWQNDLNANAVTAPVWTAIPGMADFVDDQLGVNSGTQPYTSGYAGFGFYSKDISRRAYFDQLILQRQL